MIRLAIAILGILLFWQISIAPAHAGKNDDLWAACIWEKAPTSANNWLNMTPAKKESVASKDDKYKLLATRIQGFCHKTLIPEGKKYPPSFNDRSVRAALEKSRPAQIGPDSSDEGAFRCEIYEDEVLLGETIGFGDAKGLMPRPPVTEIKCQRIQNDGTLIDA